MEKNYCVHPGEIIKAILMSINKSQKWLATNMKVNKIIISDLIRGKRNITPNIAKAFENATGFSAEALLQQQDKYDLFNLCKEPCFCGEIDVSSENNTNESIQINNRIDCFGNCVLQYAV